MLEQRYRGIPRGLLLPVAAILALQGGCDADLFGSDAADHAASATLYKVGGTVAGLASGESVVLLDNSANALTVSANGSFTFGTQLSSGMHYAITVGTQPAGQTCSVTGGSGQIGTVPVSNAAVTCSNLEFALGGTIQGLSASGLVLANGSVTLPVAANATSFTLPAQVPYMSHYAVTVQSQPSDLMCTLANGSGTMGTSAVTNIAVTCVPTAFSVGGTITGLGTAGLVLVNGTDTLVVPANATSFTMPAKVAIGATYNVSVRTSPATVICTASNGSGTVAGSNVSNISIACAGGTETVLHSFGVLPDSSYPGYGHLVQASDGSLYGMTSGGGTANLGSAFRIAPDGTESVIHSFTGADGDTPQSGLLLGSDGNLYGMAAAGGANANGLVFRLTAQGVETVLWSFTGPEGAGPDGTLIQASDGNFYGMTLGGGANNEGAVFRITPQGAETLLWSFGTGADGSLPYGDLLQGSDGNFYGMTYAGGANGTGTVFKITPAGVETVLWSFGSGSDGQNPYGNLIQASDGNFYGMTYGGGTNGAGVAFMITPAGAESVIWNFGNGYDGTGPFGSLIQANDGNLYGLTFQGGANGVGTLFRLTLAGQESVVWSFGGGSDGYQPLGSLIQGQDGSLYGMTGYGGVSNYGVVFQFN